MHENEVGLLEYDITATPRDFTPAMIVELIDSGIMEIPVFQRNFVWDVKRASLLIESLILGLPVPELFLYSEDDENSTYKIIDGQQRILSIYFFSKGRFPKNPEGHLLIRSAFQQWADADLREKTLSDDNLFRDFRLEMLGNRRTGVSRHSVYDGKMFNELKPDMKVKFRLRRSVRGVIIRQNKPDDSSSSMFEIFSRLNTGGVKLTPQEVRASLFYCDFYRMIAGLNESRAWSDLYGKSIRRSKKVVRGEDIEAILRAFAFYENADHYQPTMEGFLNRFSKESMRFSEGKTKSLEKLFEQFIDACSLLPEGAFLAIRGNQFLQTLFYSVFTVVCRHFDENSGAALKISPESFKKLKENNDFSRLYKYVSNSRVSMAALLDMAKDTIEFVEAK